MKTVVITGGTRESTIEDAKKYFTSAGFGDQIAVYPCNVSNSNNIAGL